VSSWLHIQPDILIITIYGRFIACVQLHIRLLFRCIRQSSQRIRVQIRCSGLGTRHYAFHILRHACLHLRALSAEFRKQGDLSTWQRQQALLRLGDSFYFGMRRRFAVASLRCWRRGLSQVKLHERYMISLLHSSLLCWLRRGRKERKAKAWRDHGEISFILRSFGRALTYWMRESGYAKQLKRNVCKAILAHSWFRMRRGLLNWAHEAILASKSDARYLGASFITNAHIPPSLP